MQNYIKRKIDIENFLQELKKLLQDKGTNLNIINNKKNIETLIQLNYNSEDVKNELMNIKTEEYVESVPDTKDGITLNIFSKTIKKQQIYIKVKISSKENGKVLCLSFHFAEYPIKYFPYK